MFKRYILWLWKPRIEKAIQYWWDVIEETSFQLSDGSLITAQKESEGNLFRNEYVKILLDGKPVCEMKMQASLGHEWLTLERFNYGEWTRVFWHEYCKKQAEIKKLERIRINALFEPLDE